MNRLVFGVGILDNDEKVTKHTQVKGKNGKMVSKQIWMCPYYSRWRSMLARCYDEKYLQKRPTYRGCYVCDEWLYFSKFKKWMSSHDWKGKHLDKDFIKNGNKVYSPETCVFLSLAFNNFPITCSKIRGDFPIGVTYDKSRDKYHAKVTNGDNKNIFLGRHSTPEEAHRAWQLGKIEVGETLISKADSTLVINGLKRMIENIRKDFSNNVETKIY